MGKMNVRLARERLHKIADRLDRSKKTTVVANELRDIVEENLYRAIPKKVKKRR
jgi:hypothetical protein